MQSEQQIQEQTQKLEKYWDTFSNVYDTTAKVPSNFFYSMLNIVKIEQRQRVLEVACGPGYHLPIALMRKNASTEYTAIDLSAQMLAISVQRVKDFLQQGTTNFRLQKLPQQVSPFTEKVRFDEFNLTIDKANSEALPYPDNYFDCYLSNLCLQLTASPEAMLREAYRVLQPGTPAVFTVWGRQEESQYFVIPGQVLRECNLAPPGPESRSNFHLNDREKLIAMAEAAGFTKILAWSSFEPFDTFDDADFDMMFNTPLMRNTLAQASEEAKAAFKEKFKNAFLEYYRTTKKPVGLEALYITGVKAAQPK